MNYFVFTDEAGAYKSQTTLEFRKRHPFYVRSNVIISMDDYRDFQKEISIPIFNAFHDSDLFTSPFIDNQGRNCGQTICFCYDITASYTQLVT